MKKPELLCPAGNFEKLKMAVVYGADAVYFSGEKFGLRAFADNFTLDEISDGIKFAHDNNVKAYVTVNIFAHPADFSGMKEYIKHLDNSGVDGVIVSDPGVFSLVRETSGDMDIHISTQSNVTNARACKFWHKAGAKRVVLARELTLEEIRGICDKIPNTLETEVFVHGAMCMTYSGRCLLSNYFTSRGANEGKCAHPCRWEYSVTEKDRKDDPLLIEEDGRGSYILSSKDLCMIEHIPQLIEAGISSFKVEGRMKGSYYVAAVTKAYREVIDEYFNNPEGYVFNQSKLDELKKTVHREFDTGFFFQSPSEDAKIFYEGSYIKKAMVAGMVTDYDFDTRRVTVRQMNKISEGDTLEILSPGKETISVYALDLRDEHGIKIDSTPHAKMIYTMDVGFPVEKNSFLRIINK